MSTSRTKAPSNQLYQFERSSSRINSTTSKHAGINFPSFQRNEETSIPHNLSMLGLSHFRKNKRTKSRFRGQFYKGNYKLDLSAWSLFFCSSTIRNWPIICVLLAEVINNSFPTISCTIRRLSDENKRLIGNQYAIKHAKELPKHSDKGSKTFNITDR